MFQLYMSAIFLSISGSRVRGWRSCFLRGRISDRTRAGEDYFSSRGTRTAMGALPVSAPAAMRVAVKVPVEVTALLT